ncbi:MAG: cyclic pyranopterin monophosphate synthase MoaC [Planctomycetes bacterium]|jgi:cyclic pyranopterin phosphate synthase|nr:cyclic pyranopterin monophosphate synthase MoaC [Planctomycetota bacterium]
MSMADVSGKRITVREARAEAIVRLGPEAAAVLAAGTAPKGDVLGTARLAGILAAKKTAELIPLCHPIPVDHAGVEAVLEGSDVRIITSVRTRAPTGVEMEAMTAAAVAALTVYDMLKSVSKGIVVGPVRLLSKSGGRSGDWRAADGPD